MYIITFIDNSTFTDRKHITGQWNFMPNKQIKRIEFSLFGKTILLENYEAYNHLVIRGIGVNTKINSIMGFIVMGSYKNKVHKFAFDIIKKELRVEEVFFGKEYNNAASTGWKKGISSENPTYKII